MNDVNYLIKLAEFVRIKAAWVSRASHSGNANAAALAASVDAFLDGLNRRVPERWKKFETEMKSDDYKRYEELRKRFGPP